MKEAERKRKILYHQHLTSRCDAQTAARDVLALQAQFLRHAQMSLRLRTRDDSWKQWVKQSVKTRAFRGTLHLLDAEDRLLITSALWKDYEHRKYYMARYYTPIHRRRNSFSAMRSLICCSRASADAAKFIQGWLRWGWMKSCVSWPAPAGTACLLS